MGFSISGTSLAQDTQPESFQTHNKKLSPSVERSVYASLRIIGSSLRTHSLTHSQVASFETAYSIYIGNQEETGFFDFANKQIKTGYLQNGISEEEIDQALKTYSSLGLPPLDTSAIKAELTNIQQSDILQITQQINRSGLESIAKNRIQELSSRLHEIADEDSSAGKAQKAMYYFHSAYCNVLAGETFIAIITGNEIGGAVGFIAMYMSNC
jgi:hypothetical protein